MKSLFIKCSNVQIFALKPLFTGWFFCLYQNFSTSKSINYKIIINKFVY